MENAIEPQRPALLSEQLRAEIAALPTNIVRAIAVLEKRRHELLQDESATDEEFLENADDIAAARVILERTVPHRRRLKDQLAAVLKIEASDALAADPGAQIL